MALNRLELTPHFHIEHFSEVWGRGISFEYVERSPDPWYSDCETSVEIDEAMARKIIDTLKSHFNI